LQNGDKEEKLGERNDSVTISIGHLKDIRLVLFKVGLVVFDLCVVVGSECPEKVSISHHKLTFCVLGSCKGLKYLLWWAEKADLVLVGAAYTVLSWGLLTFILVNYSKSKRSNKE
jgi:hypothetical protein